MWAKCSETLLWNTLLTIVCAVVCYCEVFCRDTCQISCLEQLTCCTTEQWRWTATVQTEIIGTLKLFCFLLTISAFVAFKKWICLSESYLVDDKYFKNLLSENKGAHAGCASLGSAPGKWLQICLYFAFHSLYHIISHAHGISIQLWFVWTSKQDC